MTTLKYNCTLSISVDPDASFLEADQDTNVEVLRDLIYNAIYDIDDIKIQDLEVEEDD